MKLILLFVTAVWLLLGTEIASAKSRWGADYFPNTELTTHDGETVYFFDDLIKDKVVVINFIYTQCPDTCPLETAQLTRVQDILGDRVGRDVFIYSITIDPQHDSVDVLRNYRSKFGARWTFLTGDHEEIVHLRRMLGLYIENNEGGPNNHNVNMLIGNQSTGRWMRRSPFENPHVLADQIGNWLTDWKQAHVVRDYGSAPELRKISDGEKLYRTRCMGCHTNNGSSGSALGPDLLGVTMRRDRQWLIEWLRAPDKLLANGDPIAVALRRQYKVAMPNLRLNQTDIEDLLRFLDSTAATVRPSVEEAASHSANSRTITHATDISGLHASQHVHANHHHDASKSHTPATADSFHHRSSGNDTVAVMNAWIQSPVADSEVTAGYLTLVNSGDEDVSVVAIHSDVFADIEMHEMTSDNGLMTMHHLQSVLIPAKDIVQFVPGGKHLMISGVNRPTAVGEHIRLTLTFSSGQQQAIPLEIRSR